MKTDAVSFALGQILYMKLKPEVAGMVTGILFIPSGHRYYVTWGSDMVERCHYECELTAEKNFVVADS